MEIIAVLILFALMVLTYLAEEIRGREGNALQFFSLWVKVNI